ncbi:MAG: hypothetical protein ACK43N_24330, partial [Pirellulaceae bacterium]
PLHLCTSAPLHLCTSAPLHLCTSAPPCEPSKIERSQHGKVAKKRKRRVHLGCFSLASRFTASGWDRM